MPLLVAKISGNLAGERAAPIWLDALAAWPGELVIVPGSGLFGAAVRAAQRMMGFNDLMAHHMALLAMEQYGLALAAARPSPLMCATEDELRAAIAQRRIAIWSPARMAMTATDLPATWNLTSDSLAAWLAGQFSAAHLLLIKNVDAPSPASTAGLSRRDMVDPLFPEFATLARCPIWIAGPADCAEAEATLAAGRMPGVRVTSMRQTAGS